MGSIQKIVWIFIQLALFLLCLEVPCIAQSKASIDSLKNRDLDISKIKENMKKDSLEVPTISDPDFRPPADGPLQMTDTVKAIYEDALYAYYEYQVTGFEHRRNVFDWQLYSSKIIFWCVLFLVFSGICFSGIQFYRSIKTGPQEGAGPTGGSATEFEATAKGIKITSPVLGVIILVISLVFFYLYLVYVYPIREIF